MTKMNHVKPGNTRKTLRSVFIALSCFAVALTLAQMAQAQTNTFPSSGNAGIGTTTPTYPLDVLSSAQWAARFKKTDATHGGIIIDAATGFNPNVALSVNGTIKWYMNNNVANGDTLQFWESTGQYPRFTLTQAGNVGIGTATPGGRLTVLGYGLFGNITTHTQLYSGFDSQANQVLEIGNGTSHSEVTPLPIFILSNNTTATNNATGIIGQISFANRSIADNNEKRVAMISGWVDGASNSGTLQFYTSSAGVLAERLRVTSGGNVGIGTTNPASNLQIGSQTSGSTSNPVALSLGGTYSNAAGANLKLKLYDDGVGANTYGIGVSSGSMDFGVATTAGYHWYSGGTNKMTLTSSGDLSVSGTIQAKYQDVAEWVQSDEQLSAGTVVVLDSTKSNQVISSTTGYDTRVAGVISAQPGIALGESGEGKVLVATTGRVRVKVDATRAPIRIGDLLVTSDIPGLAMKSEPIMIGGRQMHSPGTLIGKALEPLAKGKGEILVLLSLQ